MCGEASGDVMAAPVLARLRERTPPLAPYGLGGPALAEVGFTSLARLHELSGMGFAAAKKWSRLLRCYRLLQRETHQRRPRAALLVGFSDFNARLGTWLRRQGVRVLWYAPPQIWAWRAGRAKRLKQSADQLALTLPFEAALWKRHGARAEYVGHPALERIAARVAYRPRAEPIGSLATGDLRIALLPGSREAEVRKHWPLLRDAVAQLRRQHPSWTFSLFISAALAPTTQRLLRDAAARADLDPVSDAPSQQLADHDLALCCSGTATLECALAGCPPVIFFHTGKLSEIVLRHLLRVPHVGLPNLLLERRAFPELVGQAATSTGLSAAATAVSHKLSAAALDCSAVSVSLRVGLDGTSPSERVAKLLHPWLT